MLTTVSATENQVVQVQGLGLNRRGCLALNASYEPLTMIPFKRAVRLVSDGRAEILEADGSRALRSANIEIPYPSVIRLVRIVRVPRRFRKRVSNVFLFARDRFSCAYCGRHRDDLGEREYLTRDHIVPQSRFQVRDHSNTWTNCVTACSTCNGKKDNRTPAEAGMALLITPVEPQFVKLVWSVRKLTALQRKYVARFYGEDALGAIEGR